MPRAFSYGNRHVLVLLDRFARIRDFYYPYVGLENHIAGRLAHNIGVFVEGQFSWTHSGEWTIRTSVDVGWTGTIRLEHPRLRVVVTFEDSLYHEKDIFLRRITIENLEKRERTIKVFFNQQFELYHSERGDTAYFDPRDNAVIHYEGRRVFHIYARVGATPFDEYTTGIFHIEGKEGTYKDAEDGVLQKNPIEHGSVDSTIGLTFQVEAEKKKQGEYWITVGESIEDAKALHEEVLQMGTEHVSAGSHDFWKAWVDRYPNRFYGLSEGAVELFKKSQLYLRSHVDRHGAVIASGDTDMLESGRDTYAYVWPRDAAFATVALDQIGDRHSARRFFEFAAKTMKPEGYFMHRNRSDGSLGSSWHPWIIDGKTELPIQEDETALILWALWQHYEMTRDLEFIESLYHTMILPAAKFLLNYRDPYTGLPKQSYNLWEEKWGVHTFTAASVYAGLEAAAEFSGLLGHTRNEHNFRHTATEVSRSIMNHLYDDRSGLFWKTIVTNDHGSFTQYETQPDASSAYGVYVFGVLPPGDARLDRAFEHTIERLTLHTPVGGIARYAGDQYYRIAPNEPGNPWIITSLWMAQYTIEKARSDADLDRAREWLNWCVDIAGPTGILPEQMNPYTKDHLSAAPLTWSHAEYIRTVVLYLNKLRSLNIIPQEPSFGHNM